MKLSLICPCYNESENVAEFVEVCNRAFENRIDSYEFVLINDGSKDDTWNKLKELYALSQVNMKIINFSRNFGKEAAMYAGLQKAEGEYTCFIDTDLQQPPEKVVEMVEILENNPDCDCVAAYQKSRAENKIVSAFKSAFYKIINKMSDIDFQSGASDFRTFRQGVRDALLSMGEYHRFLKGMFSWVGFNTHYIEYTALERQAGTTSWSFMKLVKYAFTGILAFSTLPLKLAAFIGSAFSVLSLLYMVVVIIEKLVFDIAIPGYATAIVLILLIGGIQLMCLGILGEYISLIYVQGKKRPVFIIKNYESKKTDE